MISFAVPGSIVPWARPRLGEHKIPFTPKRQRDYAATLKSFGADAMEGRPPFQGAIEVKMLAIYPIPMSWPKRRQAAALWHTGKPDADNIGKIAKDALKNVVWRDDAQVASLHVWKKYGPIPGLTIHIREMTGELL